jgi:hypothetical protein
MIVAVLWRLGQGRGEGIENEKLKIRLRRRVNRDTRRLATGKKREHGLRTEKLIAGG